MQYPSFVAHPITGSGRGKNLGTPTINVRLEDVPTNLEEGIYGCYVRLSDEWLPAALHYGPRPVFNDSDSCEVYILDHIITDVPDSIDIQPIGYVRTVQNFPSATDMMARITQDVEEIRAMLQEYGPASS